MMRAVRTEIDPGANFVEFRLGGASVASYAARWKADRGFKDVGADPAVGKPNGTREAAHPAADDGDTEIFR
jgi:hypothetical protein